MGQKARIMYIERKAGELTGPARIGRLTFSKTQSWRFRAEPYDPAIYYRGKELRSLKGAGFKANYYDVEQETNTGFPARARMGTMHSTPPTSPLRSMPTLVTNIGHR
jgi:hypothetical protein